METYLTKSYSNLMLGQSKFYWLYLSTRNYHCIKRALRISLHLLWMRKNAGKNADQNNFEYGLFLRVYRIIFRKLAVSKHIRTDGNYASDFDFVCELIEYLKIQLTSKLFVHLLWLTEAVMSLLHSYAWKEEWRFYWKGRGMLTLCEKCPKW